MTDAPQPPIHGDTSFKEKSEAYLKYSENSVFESNELAAAIYLFEGDPPNKECKFQGIKKVVGNLPIDNGE